MEGSPRMKALMIKSKFMEGFSVKREGRLMLNSSENQSKCESFVQPMSIKKREKTFHSQLISSQTEINSWNPAEKNLERRMLEATPQPDGTKIAKNTFISLMLDQNNFWQNNFPSKTKIAQETPRFPYQPKQGKNQMVIHHESQKAIPQYLKQKHTKQILEQSQKTIPLPSTNSHGKMMGNIKRTIKKGEKIMKKNVPFPLMIESSAVKNRKNEKSWVWEDFVQLKVLGVGKYGKVYLMKDKKTNILCAVKAIHKELIKEEEITQQFIRELKIQSYLNHRNLIKTYGYFCDETFIYIIMEPALGGQLHSQYTFPIHEKKASHLLKQICDGLGAMHRHHIIHRDLKPENIVMHEGMLKICDFGWSVHVGNSLRKTFCGTPLYVSPEILKGEEYNEKIDVWALGVILFEMVFGEDPFQIKRESELVKIVDCQFQLPGNVKISKDAHHFLMNCLQKNPAKRMDITDILLHPFIKSL